MAGTSAESEIARKTWELENDIETIPASDEIFRYDTQEQQQFLSARMLFGFHFIDSHTIRSNKFTNCFYYHFRTMGQRSALLQRHSNFGLGSVENGDARPIRWLVRNYGTFTWQSG